MEQDYLVCRGSVSEDINIPSVTKNIIMEVSKKTEDVSLKLYFQRHLL